MKFADSISPGQLQTAQVLWAQYARRSLDIAGDDRDARLQFAGKIVGRVVPSFRALTRYEAHQLIDEMKKAMGLPVTIPSRALAEDRGLQGRRRSPRHDVMASREDLNRISTAAARLGWSEERFQKWLESPSSPLKGKIAVRTQADANRVWWALKNMLKRAGQWSA
jgi:hypothetical protein